MSDCTLRPERPRYMTPCVLLASAGAFMIGFGMSLKINVNTAVDVQNEAVERGHATYETDGKTISFKWRDGE